MDMMDCSPQNQNDSRGPDIEMSDLQENNHSGQKVSGVISNEKTPSIFHTYRAATVEDAVDEDDISIAIARMSNLQMNFADPPELPLNNTAAASFNVRDRTPFFLTNFNSAPEPSLGAPGDKQFDHVPAQELHVLLSGSFYGKLVIQTPVDAVAALHRISRIRPGVDNIILYAYGSTGLSNHSGASIQYRKRHDSPWVSTNFAMYGLRSALDVSLFVLAQALEVAVIGSKLEREGKVVIAANSSAAIAHIQQLSSIPESPRNIHMRRIFAFSKLLHERGFRLEIHWSPNQSDFIGSARAEGYSDKAKKEARHFFQSKIFTACPIGVVLPIHAVQDRKHQLQTIGRRTSIQVRKEVKRYSITTGKIPTMVLGRFKEGFKVFDSEMLEPVRPVGPVQVEALQFIRRREQPGILAGVGLKVGLPM
jgi:hypothetical protein